MATQFLPTIAMQEPCTRITQRQKRLGYGLRKRGEATSRRQRWSPFTIEGEEWTGMHAVELHNRLCSTDIVKVSLVPASERVGQLTMMGER